MLRTAILRGIRPTSLLRRKQPYSKWDELDFLLADAYQIHEDEKSNDHGLPLWLSRTMDPNIFFQVEEREDAASALLEKWDKDHPHDKRKPGTSRFVVAVGADGKPIDYGGLTRESFKAEEVEVAEFRETLEELGFDPDELEDMDLPIQRRRPAGGYDPSEYGDGPIESQ